MQITIGERTQEINTHATCLASAKRFAEKVEDELAERLQGKVRTVSQTVDSYIAWHNLSADQLRRLRRLQRVFQDTPLRAVGQDLIDRAAHDHFADCKPITRRLHVYSPMNELLRHAGLADRVRPPKIVDASVAVLTRATAECLLAQCDDPDYKAFLTLLFFSGMRKMEAADLTWDRVDLNNRRVLLRLSFRHIDSWRPIHLRSAEALNMLSRRSNRVFRWASAKRLENPMKSLRTKTGIYFNHRMARASFASWLAQRGASLRDIMDAGGWAGPERVIRIVGTDGERDCRTIDLLSLSDDQRC